MNETAAQTASRPVRLGGAIVDGLIQVAILVPIMLAAGVLQQTFRGEKMTFGQQAIFFVVGQVVFLLLNGYLLLKRGQTIGKVAVKTKIVDMNGNLPSFGKIYVLRYLVISLIGQIPIVGYILIIIDVLFIFGKQKRCLHDYLAGTRVVDALKVARNPAQDSL